MTPSPVVTDRTSPTRRKRLGAGQDGVSLVVFAVSLLAILLCVGLVVDGFRLMALKSRQENTAEILAITVLQALKTQGPTQGTSDAIATVNASGNSNVFGTSINLVDCSNSPPDPTSTSGCVEFGNWDEISATFNRNAVPYTAVRVSLGTQTGAIHSIFLRLAGFKDLRAASRAIAFFDLNRAHSSWIITPTPSTKIVNPLYNPYVIVREPGQ